MTGSGSQPATGAITWWVIVVTVAMVAALLPAVAARPALGIELPAGGVDWHSARQLPPLTGPGEPSAELTLDEVRAPVCVDGGCVATTVRPALTAAVDPDPDTGHSFVLFDLSGAGGLTSAVASAHHADATWAPPAGLLRHGHVYAWSATGADDEAQEWQMFVVDLERPVDQAFDEYGPFLVALATGELGASFDIGFGSDDAQLSVQYRGSASRSPEESSPLRVVSDGWTLGGSALGGASWHRLQSFADGATVVAHAVDGTSVRYERTADGGYAPPRLDGMDLTFLYPVLQHRPDGTFVMSEPDGGISTFHSGGELIAYERPTPQGAATVALDVAWSDGLIASVTDTITDRTATFDYLGSRTCRPGPGFDTGSPEPALCAVTTFTGERIELLYRQGHLARIVGGGGEVTDLAYDGSGRLAMARQPLGADLAAAGLVADDADATWRVGYDAAGRVAAITSPVPSAGQSPLVRSYSYGSGTASMADDGVPAGTITFDPADYRLFTSRASGSDRALERLYDEQRLPIGVVDERGLQTSWRTDERGNVVEAWGPAPTSWFGSDGRPLPAHEADVATTVTTYGGGAGMLGLFSDGTGADGRQSAQLLLATSTIDAVPSAVDASDGWRLTAIGDARLPIDDTSRWRLTVDAGADDGASVLVVNGAVVAAGETVELAAPAEAPPAGYPVSLWVEYVGTAAPSAASPAWFLVEYSVDDGETWSTLEPSAMRGRDLPTSTTTSDVHGHGSAPVTTTTSMTYVDPLLGLVGAYASDGVPTSSITYEAADVAAGHFARPLSLTTAAGVTTTVDYWGPADVAEHPVTGEPLPQYGRQRSVQVGADTVYGSIYDAAGRIVAQTADGAPITALTLDDRGRVDAIVSYDSPERSVHLQYGAGGDPRVTGAVSTAGDETFTLLTTVDALGRTVSEVDEWGTTTTTAYGTGGVVEQVVVETARGDRSVATYDVDAADLGFRGIAVATAAGTVESATVAAYDEAGRPTAIEYSNGLTSSIAYDPVTGQVASQRWTDGDGHGWDDEVTRTTQSGRILSHRLAGPYGSASFTYRYDPATGYLDAADVVGTGSGPDATSWSYGYTDGARTERVTATAEATVTLEQDLDGMLAPVRVVERTAAATGGMTERDLAIGRAGTDIVHVDGTDLAYDVNGVLTGASDGATTIELLRDATGNVLRQEVVQGSVTTVLGFSGPFVLDGTGAALAQTVGLPGGVTVLVPLDGAGATWHVPTLAGDAWWSADAQGRSTDDVTHFGPDGERLTGAHADPGALDGRNGWRAGHSGVTLALDTTLVLFGARAYLPELGIFTTTDPIAHAGPTPYSYADNDPVNLVDPTGNSSQGAFDSWDSPGWELVITVGLTLLAVGLMAAGQAWAAAAVMAVLAGYLGYLSYAAFAAGDYVGGAIYAVSAVLTLTMAVGVAVRMAGTTAYIWRIKTGTGVNTVMPFQRTTVLNKQALVAISKKQAHQLAKLSHKGSFTAVGGFMKSRNMSAGGYFVKSDLRSVSTVRSGAGGTHHYRSTGERAQSLVRFETSSFTSRPVKAVFQGVAVTGYMAAGPSGSMYGVIWVSTMITGQSWSWIRVGRV